jgi:hypothetical protein
LCIFRRSKELARFILWLLLSILLCPYKVLRSVWSYFLSLSHRNRRAVAGGTKPVSKKLDQGHTMSCDAPPEVKMATDQWPLSETEELPKLSEYIHVAENISPVGCGGKKGIRLLIVCYSDYIHPSCVYRAPLCSSVHHISSDGGH